jgi:uncharacterized SAM-binding protein YcdF (DUF218 family)
MQHAAAESGVNATLHVYLRAPSFDSPNMHLLLSPLGLGILIALVLLATWRRMPRWLRAVAIVFEVLALIACSPVGANALVWLIESRVPQTETCAAPAPSAVVVLSGGLERPPLNAEDFAALDPDSVQRMLSAVALWKRTPSAPFAIAGGGPFAISESEVLSHLAEQLGVPTASIVREGESQTTWENAQQLRRLQPALPDRIWLVSSAIHLPRALASFRAVGFDPCIHVSDRDYLAPQGIGYYLPQSSAVRKSETAIHELLGQALYAFYGRSGKSS